MRTSLLTICCLFILGIAYGQSFEGKIVYQLNYKSKSPALSEEQLRAYMGSEQEYWFKEGVYKTVITTPAMVQWQLFNPADNKLYNKFSQSETLYWNDALVNQDSVLATQLNKAVLVVNGYTCDELILTCKTGIQKYYFNATIKADASLFTRHKYGNWYEYISRANALPLKYIIETPQFIIETTAVQVVPMKVEEATFQLPANAKAVKSPY